MPAIDAILLFSIIIIAACTISSGFAAVINFKAGTVVFLGSILLSSIEKTTVNKELKRWENIVC